MKRSIKSRLKDFTTDELKQAIDNYATVYQSNSHWFSYKYSLGDLMREKDINKFIDEVEPLRNFSKDKLEGNANAQTELSESECKECGDISSLIVK